MQNAQIKYCGNRLTQNCALMEIVAKIVIIEYKLMMVHNMGIYQNAPALLILEVVQKKCTLDWITNGFIHLDKIQYSSIAFANISPELMTAKLWCYRL